MEQNLKKKLIVCGSVMAGIAVATMITLGIINGNNVNAGSGEAVNGVILQGFEWYLESTGTHWNDLADKASELSEAGFTAIWLPPAYKGKTIEDVGYGPYDLYDLGEFNQKGTVRTKYGTKDEYLALIETLHDEGIQAYADIVLNHKNGADASETVSVYECSTYNRGNVISGPFDITAWCVFDYEGRNGKYSTFTWDSSCFDGMDTDNGVFENRLFKFAGKEWDWQVDTENGNYDYLMCADIDFDNREVVEELKTWGEWYVDFANLDGFRLDAVKHIKFDFFEEWLTHLRGETGKELFSVGEYWSGDVNKLHTYISETSGTTSLFDVPLHYNFYGASTSSGYYDMRNLFNSTLVISNPTHAVTFVDNHDSQPGQSLQSTVMSWFKPLAYTAILTREGGYPCVFYGDYYGTNDGGISSHKTVIDKILKARKDYAYGTQHDYLDDANIIGWTREGDSSHENSGLAALITDGAGGSKSMYVGKSHAGEIWYDITGNYSTRVTIDSNGYGTFSVLGGSHSIWVPTGYNDDVIPEGNTATIYYYNSNSWSDVYIHYGVNDKWTTVPGIKMEETSNNKYLYATINLGEYVNAQVCFNNGVGSWDSRNGANYVINAGKYSVKDGYVTPGEPLGLFKTPEPATTESPVITTNPVTTEVPSETETPLETIKPNSNFVNVYYYNSNNWSDVYIHYQVEGSSWTEVPGVKMTKSDIDGYYVYTIDLGTKSKAEVCFNNGYGSWDSRNAANYSVSQGDYIVKQGNVTVGTP